MSKTTKIAFLLFAGLATIASAGSAVSTTSSPQCEKVQSELFTTIDSLVSAILASTQQIPGLKSEELQSLRPQIAETWNKLVKEGVLEVSGTDKDVRPSFVWIQAVVEHVLAERNIKNLTGFIHTPMPATPLCTKGEISQQLVHPAIEEDPDRLLTVKARTEIVRRYLANGGDLHIVYPEKGFQKRTKEQQAIYREALEASPHHLFDDSLSCDSIPTDLIGATYLFKDEKTGKTFVFAIKMTQAKDPQETGHFALWFGSIENPAIQKRLRAVADYMADNGVPALQTMIAEAEKK